MLTSHRLRTRDVTRVPFRHEPFQRLQSRASSSRPPWTAYLPCRPRKLGAMPSYRPLGKLETPIKTLVLRRKPFRPQQFTKAVPAPAGRRYIALPPEDPDKQTEPQYTASLSQECEKRSPLLLKVPPRPRTSAPSET